MDRAQNWQKATDSLLTAICDTANGDKYCALNTKDDIYIYMVCIQDVLKLEANSQKHERAQQA